jgi:7,8-dihydroneopterin aldolase/epimerase/oxygenase
VPDRIELRGLRAVGVHGALPEEQDRAQPFEVDLDVALDLGPAGRSDALEDTVNYGDLVAAADRVVRSESHQLLERIAQRIAEEVLAEERVASVRVVVRKLRPPVPQDLASCGVAIERQR